MADQEQAEPRLGPIGSTIGQMPWWAQLGLVVASSFGVPTLIVGFYLAQEAGWVDNPVANRLEELKGVSIVHELTMKEVGLEVRKQTEQFAKSEEARQMRCVLRAQDEQQKRACFPSIQ